MVQDFKDFINRGNVLDLAVAVILGAALTAIVNSLVNDIIMPIVGVALGGVDFSTLSVMVGDASINYGLFIQAVVDFLIIALVIFLIVRAVNRSQGQAEDEAPAEPEAPPEDIALLTEIRDLLKERAG